ncbi:MAG: hypothetical protein FWH12_03775 [Treponema sp.]|nr:hypothetical protein [Treponema sp.]
MSNHIPFEVQPKAGDKARMYSWDTGDVTEIGTVIVRGDQSIEGHTGLLLPDGEAIWEGDRQGLVEAELINWLDEEWDQDYEEMVKYLPAKGEEVICNIFGTLQVGTVEEIKADKITVSLENGIKTDVEHYMKRKYQLEREAVE